ncbi:hypothetical protein BpHYR1_052779 [Brachionus plicatilis]|uniref:Uncharacterized protein n=1 Tax=Brachionus plicatilis TaxID=10195 RepID=A0A3M7T0W4_BRAPC|nr:hypothetical protein BpHYR1_052779 [Brachionus plicatilis]
MRIEFIWPSGLCVSHTRRGSRVQNLLRENKSSKYLCNTGQMLKALSSLKMMEWFLLGSNCGVEDQLNAVTSLSDRSSCS